MNHPVKVLYTLLAVGNVPYVCPYVTVLDPEPDSVPPLVVASNVTVEDIGVKFALIVVFDVMDPDDGDHPEKL